MRYYLLNINILQSTRWFRFALRLFLPWISFSPITTCFPCYTSFHFLVIFSLPASFTFPLLELPYTASLFAAFFSYFIYIFPYHIPWSLPFYSQNPSPKIPYFSYIFSSPSSLFPSNLTLPARKKPFLNKTNTDIILDMLYVQSISIDLYMYLIR